MGNRACNDGSQSCADDPTQSTLTKRNYVRARVLQLETTHERPMALLSLFRVRAVSSPKLHLSWYETCCQVHTAVQRTIICISCVLWSHQSNSASESLGIIVEKAEKNWVRALEK